MAEVERTPEEEARRNKSLAVPNCVVVYMDGSAIWLHVQTDKLGEFTGMWDLVTHAMFKREYDPTGMAGFLVFQTGVHPDVQRNGCQIEDVLQPLYERAEKLNEIVPSKENTEAILHIRAGWLWLKERTRMRRARGIEGSYKK